MTGIRFCGTGSYLPPLTVDNGEYAKIVDTSDEWIRPRTGIVTRHIANGETTWRRSGWCWSRRSPPISRPPR